MTVIRKTGKVKGGGTKSGGGYMSVEKKGRQESNNRAGEKDERVSIICIGMSTDSNKAVTTTTAAYPLDHSSV